MEYYEFLMYKRTASCVGRANIKNGTGPFKEPAPAGFRTDGGVGWLAGARCSKNVQNCASVGPPVGGLGPPPEAPKWRPTRSRRCARATPARDPVSRLSRRPFSLS